MKLEDIWHHFSQYLVYILSMAIALSVDFVTYGLALLFNLPTSSSVSLSQYLATGSNGMGQEEFIIRAVDGKLWLWDVTISDMLQIGVLSLTLIATALKIVLDVRKAWKEHKDEKNYRSKKRK